MEPTRLRAVAVLAALTAMAGLAGPLGAQEPSRSILLSSHVIDTGDPEKAAPRIPRELRARVVPGADEIVLVQFPGPVTAERDRALRETAVRVYTYLPHNAFLVKMPAGWRHRKAALGMAWTGSYHPFYKISRSIAAVDGEAPAKAGERSQRSLMVQVFPDADVREVVQQMKDAGVPGIVGLAQGGYFSKVRLLMTNPEIARHREALAKIPDVFWIDFEPRRALLNDTTIWVGQSGLSGGQTTPIFSQGIFGEGQIVGIMDTGIDIDMCYFRDTALGLPPTNNCNLGTVVNNNQRKVIAVDFMWTSECNGGISGSEWDTQDHGSHVAGTVAGDNFANLLTHNAGDGMAPGAKLVIQDAGYLVDNCGDIPGLGCPIADLNPFFLQAYNQGARLHTNSWGDNENAAVQNNYSAGSQDVDEFMWNHKDFLVFFAAGNSGPSTGTVGSPSTNKNGVSVGATLRGTSADSMASFSSCGPTTDGRRKPDITIPGSSIVSANNDLSITTNNCGTKTSSGTSMASPGAAGLAALIRQYFADGWYPTGAEVPANGFSPSAAMVKATLVNSAVNMTGTTAIPANCQGWGRVLLENALFFTGQTRKLWVKDDATPFNTGSVNEDRTFTFTVTAGEPLKVTLAWTDFPSTPAASINLVNDLNLRVTGPTGTLWLGNVFASGQSTTGGTADNRNTLEQVLLNAPAAGTYTVTVRSATVPTGPQPFALVVTGNAVEGAGGPPPVTVFFDDFETSLGWTVNPLGTDTATTGLWERGDPEATNSSGAKQLGTTVSGVNDLVTARLAGASAGVNDLDGGTTTIQSPLIALPSTGALTLSFSYYLAHGSNATTADFFRVQVVGSTTSTVFEDLAAAADVDAVWTPVTVSLAGFAGQSVRIRISAADASTASLVEAAVDDVRVTQQP